MWWILSKYCGWYVLWRNLPNFDTKCQNLAHRNESFKNHYSFTSSTIELQWKNLTFQSNNPPCFFSIPIQRTSRYPKKPPNKFLLFLAYRMGRGVE